MCTNERILLENLNNSILVRDQDRIEHDEFNLDEFNDLDLSEDGTQLLPVNDQPNIEPEASGYLDQFAFDSNFDIKDSVLDLNSFEDSNNVHKTKLQRSLSSLEKLRSSNQDKIEYKSNYKGNYSRNTDLDQNQNFTLTQLREQLATQKEISRHLKEKHKIEISNIIQQALHEKEEILVKFRTKIGEETCNYKKELEVWNNKCIDLEAFLQQKTLKIAELEGTCSELDKRCVEFKSNLEIKNGTMAELEKNCIQFKSYFEQKSLMFAELEAKYEKREHDYHSLKNELKNLKNHNSVEDSTKDIIKRLQEENLELDRYGRMKNKLCEQLKSENIQINQDFREKDRLVDKLLSEKADMEHLVERLKTNVAELDLKCEQAAASSEFLV